MKNGFPVPIPPHFSSLSSIEKQEISSLSSIRASAHKGTILYISGRMRP